MKIVNSDQRAVAAEEIGDIIYQVVILRPDQIELIAEAVIRKLKEQA